MAPADFTPEDYLWFAFVALVCILFTTSFAFVYCSILFFIFNGSLHDLYNGNWSSLDKWQNSIFYPDHYFLSSCLDLFDPFHFT